MIETAKYLEEVRQQYENFPYPARDPKDEKHRLLETELTNFDSINSYCYKGKQDFNGFRILIAGCGTGDAVMHAAEALKTKNVEIIAMDISEASLDIAQQRAKVRGINNIKWVHSSLLETPNLNLGEFDHINCCGVLHHLEDPDAGLMALKSVLKPDGCMGLMLYAQYGRTAIYQLQELMRILNGEELNLQTKVDNTKLLLHSLPETNWFAHSKDYFDDIKRYGDVGVYDLFLHSQDRAYTVPQVYDYVAKAGLHFVSFANTASKVLLKPKNLIKDPELLAKMDKLPIREQQAVAEILIGILSKHTFYVSMLPDTIATVDDWSNMPFIVNNQEDINLDIVSVIEKAQEDEYLKITNKNNKIVFRPTKHSKYFFKYLDGKNSIKDIFDKVNQELDYDLGEQEFIAEFKEIYEVFEDRDSMFLKASS